MALQLRLNSGPLREWRGGPSAATPVWAVLRDIVFRSRAFPFLGRRMAEYGLSDRQPTDASYRAVDSRGVLVRTNLPHGFNFINITGMDKQGPVFGMPGAEVNLLYIAGLLPLVIGGAGAWSLDTLLQDRKRPSSAPA